MSRDVLLALLALALLLNLAFLSQVGVLRARRGRDTATDRELAWRREAARRAAVARTLPPRLTPPTTSRTFLVTAGDRNGAERSAGDEPAATEPAPQSIAPPEPPEAASAAGVVATPAVGELPAHEPVVTTHTNGNGEGAPLVVTASPEPAPRKTRGRRFVLPPLDEDQDRSAAAIEAFLGGPPPSPGASTERPQRRRHRARRPAGTPAAKTTMLVWLQGFGDLDRVVGPARASSVSNAFRDSLRRSARATDEVREVAAGRVRIIVDADDAGATAYVERARASVQPWLELLAVPLLVETGTRESTQLIPFTGNRRVAGDR